MSSIITLEAEPSAVTINLVETALIITDMQRDFLEAGGFGEGLGQDPMTLRHIISPIQKLITEFRNHPEMTIIFLREGYASDLSDVPTSWLEDFQSGTRPGNRGKGGWPFLIRGEKGHQIIDELIPQQEDIIVDKASKNAFNTDHFEKLLRSRPIPIKNLLWTGVTTNVCVGTSVRSSNDKGFRSIVLSDCTAAYNSAWHQYELDSIKGQGKHSGRGIFGWVTTSQQVIDALE